MSPQDGSSCTPECSVRTLTTWNTTNSYDCVETYLKPTVSHSGGLSSVHTFTPPSRFFYPGFRRASVSSCLCANFSLNAKGNERTLKTVALAVFTRAKGMYAFPRQSLNHYFTRASTVLAYGCVMNPTFRMYRYTCGESIHCTYWGLFRGEVPFLTPSPAS